ncbi:hypothetical protein C8R48DRAFT_416 [Suillus tomentosus]|nr:hypothetical protein C8R48DRAFT_416 [Suillus tomentosus]
MWKSFLTLTLKGLLSMEASSDGEISEKLVYSSLSFDLNIVPGEMNIWIIQVNAGARKPWILLVPIGQIQKGLVWVARRLPAL